MWWAANGGSIGPKGEEEVGFLEGHGFGLSFSVIATDASTEEAQALNAAGAAVRNHPLLSGIGQVNPVVATDLVPSRRHLMGNQCTGQRSCFRIYP